MPPPTFPLRWESTGDQWWYASPIDWAAANGLYDVVLELLHQDANLLIKLTSLRRIRRLETVWDDESNFHGVAACRSHVARKLLRECENSNNNALIRARYGGWLLYTAASAGDLEFVKELLHRDPLLVFGEGEYGVTDILYAAARGKNLEVFKLLLDFSFLPAGISSEEGEERLSENQLVVKEEMMNRAVHCAARGGNVEILKELIGDSCDVLSYRDVQGSTLLHSASSRGQVEVVKHLTASYDTIAAAKDNQGNTALHVASYKGHLAVAETLIRSSPSLISTRNNYGDTFLHMAVAGFKTMGFRRLDRQIELMKQLVSGKFVNLQHIVNQRNKNGRTALHMAVMDHNTIQSDLVELLMKIPLIDPNVQDSDGNTPLDLLNRHPRSASSEILIKRLVSAGGRSNGQDTTSGISNIRELGFCGSPGTAFRVSDSEIFLYAGTKNAPEAHPDTESLDNLSVCSSEASDNLSTTCSLGNDKKLKYSARRLKFLLRWTKRKETTNKGFSEELSVPKNFSDRHIPLRQIYSRSPSLKQCERTFSTSSFGDLPSPSTRMKFTEGLMQGVMFQAAAKFVSSPSSTFSQASASSPKQKDIDVLESKPSKRDRKRASSLNKKFMNKYFCFGAEGLTTGETVKCSRPDRSFRRANSLVS